MKEALFVLTGVGDFAGLTSQRCAAIENVVGPIAVPLAASLEALGRPPARINLKASGGKSCASWWGCTSGCILLSAKVFCCASFK